jgi:hypothetical protein
LIHIYNSSNKFHHHLNISNHRRAIIHDRRKKMKYFYSIETIMHKFCLLLFKDFVFFIHTFFITACDTLSRLYVCVFSRSLYISFVCSSLTDRLLFLCSCSQFY